MTDWVALLPSGKVASDAIVAVMLLISVLGILWWLGRTIREFFARHWVSEKPVKSSLKKKKMSTRYE